MSLKIMIAGCAKEQKDEVGSSVKRAFADRPADEPWSVSVVKIANQWSVEINGPEARYRGLSLVAPLGDLTGSLRKAISGAGNHSKPAAAPPTPAGGGKKLAPVPCPRCGHVTPFPTPEGAGATGDYRAQAAS